MPTPSRLYDIARAHLDAVVAYYVDNDVDVPGRQYVSDGQPAWDCEQLVVYVERVYRGTPDAENAAALDHANVRTAQLWIELVRCSPVDETMPTAEAIDANAEVVLADGVLLADAVSAAKRAGDLGDCYGLAIGDWQALGPAGSFVGGRLAVRHQLTKV